MRDLFAGNGPVLPIRLPRRRDQGIVWRCTFPLRPTTKGNHMRKMAKTLIQSEQAIAAEKAVSTLAAFNRPRRLLCGNVYLEMEARFAIPKGGKNAKRKVGEYRTTTPDRGNLLKLIEDALKGTVYADDAVIVDGPSRKVWWHRDETVVVVTEIEPFSDETELVVAEI